MNILENLEPKKVMHFFEELSGIPRGSYNEKAASDYVKQFALDRNLEVVQDELFNVVIKKPGTKGKENNETVMLQGHLDIVCEKNKDTDHDFLKEGIKLKVDGDWISGTGTTLGADNGVAVAISMAILDSVDLEHPPLEVVLTSQEETGMGGALALDTDILKSTKMINIDTDTEGVFLTSCAGGTKSKGILKIDYVDIDKSKFQGYALEVKGLKGGHSGAEIDQQRGNANKLAFRIMQKIQDNSNLYIYNVDGGAKDNAIPRECLVAFMLDNNDVDKVKTLVDKLSQDIKKEFSVQDSGLEITLTESECVDKGFSKENTIALINAMKLLQNGVISMSMNIKGLVETSNNVGVVKLEDGKVVITSALRSAVLSKKEAVKDMITLVYDTFGFESEFFGDYPAWEYKAESELRPFVAKAYEELFGTEPEFAAIHAGLECGLIIGKMPNLDIIATGATIVGAHTPEEKVSISSIDKAYKLIVNLLSKL
ncbi:MAG: aminoacyl-histidine dipeptidase [Lachnospirales bacterium]